MNMFVEMALYSLIRNLGILDFYRPGSELHALLDDVLDDQAVLGSASAGSHGFRSCVYRLDVP